MFVTNLLLLQADMRVRTDLAWLELVESELLKRENGKVPPSPPPRNASPARPVPHKGR